MIPPNDWETKKCLAFSTCFLLATLVLVELAALGFDVPILRQVVSFIFLTFIPGILLLRILKIHNLNIVESLLYSVGLSLAFVMTAGVLVNFALPPFGIHYPINTGLLTCVLTIFFIILCLFAYLRDKDFRSAVRLIDSNKKANKLGFWAGINPYLLATLLPFLAILGTSVVNAYQNNLPLIVLIFIIILIIGLAAFKKFIPPQAFPFTIVMIAVALLFQTTLISGNLVGSDIHLEYYHSKEVIENGYWDATIRSNVNSCLSVVMLMPVYSLLLNMDIVWVFKIVYPLIFALVPLALFRIFRLQIKPYYAFFATIFFISLPMFFMDMVQLARQQVSELFFVLVILLLVDRRLKVTQKTALALIFSFSVIVAHYGMGTGYTVGYLTFGVLVLIFIKSRLGLRAWQWLVGKSNSLPRDLTLPRAFGMKALTILVCGSLVFMFAYYGIVASGQPLSGIRAVTDIVYNTSQQMLQDINVPRAAGSPSAPVLISPSHLSYVADQTPRLEWNAAPGATSYRLQVATNKYFIKPVIDVDGITGTHYDMTSELEWDIKYYWRVNATNASGTSMWSKYQGFKTSAITRPERRTPVSNVLPTPKLPGFVQNITTKFPMLDPLAREPLAQTALGLDFAWASPGGKVWRIFQYLVQICLIIGFIRLVFRPGTLGKLKAEYLSLCIISVLILLGIFVLPTRSFGMGATRIWQITLLLMSPLLIFGVEAIAQGLAKLADLFRKGHAYSLLRRNNLAFLQIPILVILVPYFVFNSGVVFELSKSQTTHFVDIPYSIALSSYRVDVTTVFAKQDIAAADWLVPIAERDYPIYVDHHSDKLFRWQHGLHWDRRSVYVGRTGQISSPGYIYFRTRNTHERMLTFSTGYAARQSVSFDDLPWLMQAVEKSDRIYDNDSSEILLYYGNEK